MKIYIDEEGISVEPNTKTNQGLVAFAGIVISLMIATGFAFIVERFTH